MRRLVVVGGGVSGLAAARILAGASRVSSSAGSPGLADAAASDAEVVVLESAPRLGGKLFTGRIAGIPVELGPDQFLRRDPNAERLAHLLGLGSDLVAPAARSAGVYSRARLCALPAGLVLGVPTDADALEASGILDPAGLVAFRRLSVPSSSRTEVTPAQVGLAVGKDEAEAGVSDEDHDGGQDRPESCAELSAGAIIRSLVGDEVVDRLVDPLLGGINAGSVDALSLGIVAPQIARLLSGRSDGLAALTELAATAGTDRPSPFFGLRGGLGRLVEAIRRQLVDELGTDIRTGCAVAGIERDEHGGYLVGIAGESSPVGADGVVVALPGPAAGRVLEGIVPEAASRLAGVPHVSVALATMAFEPGTIERAGIPPGWSGVLVPRVEGALTTAFSFLSTKWPWMTEGGPHMEVVRASAGRYLDERIAGVPDEVLCGRLLAELRELLSVTAQPVEVSLQRWEGAFPQYRPGHGAAVSGIQRAVSRNRGLALAGAVLGGIGIPACISSGERAAKRVLASLDT